MTQPIFMVTTSPYWQTRPYLDRNWRRNCKVLHLILFEKAALQMNGVPRMSTPISTPLISSRSLFLQGRSDVLLFEWSCTICSRLIKLVCWTTNVYVIYIFSGLCLYTEPLVNRFQTLNVNLFFILSDKCTDRSQSHLRECFNPMSDSLVWRC